MKLTVKPKCTCPKDISGKKPYFVNWVPHINTNGYRIVCKKHGVNMNSI